MLEDDSLVTALLDLLERDAPLVEVAPALGWQDGHGSTLGRLHDAREEAFEPFLREVDQIGIMDRLVAAAAHFEPNPVGCARAGSGLHLRTRGGHAMKLEIGKEWCIRMAQLEGDAEIGAGRLAVDPVFDGDVIPGAAGDVEGSNVAFSRFVRLMRRQRGITLERLADDADVDMADLVEIESNPHHKPELRTACQLATYFKVPRSGFLQVAGLTAPKDTKLFDEAVRFAVRS